MTVDETRTIREKISLETIGMNTEELNMLFSKGAAESERLIAEIRKKKGITPTHSKDAASSKPSKKNGYGYIRGAEYYSRVSGVKVDSSSEGNMMVQEYAGNNEK